MSSATPFTSAGAVKRMTAFEFPYEPMRMVCQDFFETLLLPPITSRTPSYRCELTRPRFCDSSMIWRASWANAGTRKRNASADFLLIFEGLHQRTAHRRLRGQNCRSEGRAQNDGNQHDRDSHREM